MVIVVVGTGWICCHVSCFLVQFIPEVVRVAVGLVVVGGRCTVTAVGSLLGCPTEALEASMHRLPNRLLNHKIRHIMRDPPIRILMIAYLLL